MEEAWVWAACSVAQLFGACALYARGHGASSMPSRAFCIASLGIGAGATAAGALLHSAGIHQLEDLKEAGKFLRQSLGISAREE